MLRLQRFGEYSIWISTYAKNYFTQENFSVGCVPPLAHCTYFSNQPIDVSIGEGNSVQ